MAASVALLGACGGSSGGDSSSGEPADAATSSLASSSAATSDAGPYAGFAEAGDADPAAAALAYEVAEENKDNVSQCRYISLRFLAAAADFLELSETTPCEDVMTGLYEFRGTDPIPASSLHPSVIDVTEKGDSAEVVISFDVDPAEGATLEDRTLYLAKTSSGSWVVDDSSGG